MHDRVRAWYQPLRKVVLAINTMKERSGGGSRELEGTDTPFSDNCHQVQFCTLISLRSYPGLMRDVFYTPSVHAWELWPHGAKTLLLMESRSSWLSGIINYSRVKCCTSLQVFHEDLPKVHLLHRRHTRRNGATVNRKITRF